MKLSEFFSSKSSSRTGRIQRQRIHDECNKKEKQLNSEVARLKEEINRLEFRIKDGPYIIPTANVSNMKSLGSGNPTLINITGVNR